MSRATSVGGTPELSFRALERDDLPLLSGWLAAPHVQRWWREDPDTVESGYGPSIDGIDPTDQLIVELDGRPIGLVQRCRLADHPDYQDALEPAGTPRNAATIDYLIGDAALTGRGLGPRLIDAAVADVWRRYSEVDAIVVSVQQENRPSWRALERVGFSRVWSGMVVTDDPGDRDPSFVYVLQRPEARA